MYDDSTIWSSPKFSRRGYEPPFLMPERTVSDMTPEDVRSQAAKRIEELKRRIEREKQSIAAAQEELKFWESVKQ